MAVPCQNCGRDYDVVLFAFGRTIWCTCGHRVGIGARVRQVAPSATNGFIADAMLGRLARWLRLLGFDCEHDSEATDEEIVRRAVTKGRTVLTRDRRLPEEWWTPAIYVVNGAALGEQLVEVIRHFDLAASIRVLTRCSACNCRLTPATRSDVVERIPAGVLERYAAFSECRACGRVYWEGSHAARIRALAEALAAAA